MSGDVVQVVNDDDGDDDYDGGDGDAARKAGRGQQRVSSPCWANVSMGVLLLLLVRPVLPLSLSF